MKNPAALFETNRYLGSLTEVGPTSVLLNLPHAKLVNSSVILGTKFERGAVGEFVIIESETYAILGKIVKVKLPEGERLNVEPTHDFDKKFANPIGVVQLLLSIKPSNYEIIHGIPEYPRIGHLVYSAHPQIVKIAVEYQSEKTDKLIKLARLPKDQFTEITITPNDLFGRHCAILGTTGGGKSWTVSRVLGEIARNKGKAILIDPSGEYASLSERIRHTYLGAMQVSEKDYAECLNFPYWNLTESDLFAMFRPSAGIQSPKLREALSSLKLIKLEPSLSDNGLLIKEDREKKFYNESLATHSTGIKSQDSKYEIANLPKQIGLECVWPSTKRNGITNYDYWGGVDQNNLGNCISLINRISLMIDSQEMSCIFKPDKNHKDLSNVLDEFIDSEEISILRISMKHLPFEHNTRELITNSLGRLLLNKARIGVFTNKPIVVILDEAHQFLNKSIGDDLNQIRLESFGLIAKEGRKYGLVSILATQRPRDIPEDVLSQMGMFIVHRLINERDRKVVENANSNIDASSVAFLPILKPGEALILGLNTPMGVPVEILKPRFKPKTADIQFW